ncbi:MAG: AIR synthase-related protein, partial [Trebonia sp.]
AWVRDRLDPGSTDEATLALLTDAQTSGGLVFGVVPDQVPRVTARLREAGDHAAVIGSVVRGSGQIRVC